MESGRSESHECPICQRRIRASIIENHVDRCLFLNSESAGSSSSKGLDSPSPHKRRAKSKREERIAPEERPCPSNSMSAPNNTQLLTEVLRPKSLNDFVGQCHILGENTAFRGLLEKNNIRSMILWGPPGCGKTSLVNIIETMCQDKPSFRFVRKSAVVVGIDDVKSVVESAKNELGLFKRKTILFMDEIHRFNKLQQDTFLPHVESGLITLIGATTENPSHSLNETLLSRCRVYAFEKLLSKDIEMILQRGAHEYGAIIAPSGKNLLPPPSSVVIDEGAIHWLADVSDGDARLALNSFQMAVDQAKERGQFCLTVDDISAGIKKSHIMYEKASDEQASFLSAFQNSIIGSDDNAALYWLARMLETGQDPLTIARCLIKISCQHVGLVDPMSLSLTVSTLQGCLLLGMPECDLLLAETAVYLTRTLKSTEIYDAFEKVKTYIKDCKGNLPNVPSHLMYSQKEFRSRSDKPERMSCLPDELKGISFFSQPDPHPSSM